MSQAILWSRHLTTQTFNTETTMTLNTDEQESPATLNPFVRTGSEIEVQVPVLVSATYHVTAKYNTGDRGEDDALRAQLQWKPAGTWLDLPGAGESIQATPGTSTSVNYVTACGTVLLEMGAGDDLRVRIEALGTGSPTPAGMVTKSGSASLMVSAVGAIAGASEVTILGNVSLAGLGLSPYVLAGFMDWLEAEGTDWLTGDLVADTLTALEGYRDAVSGDAGYQGLSHDDANIQLQNAIDLIGAYQSDLGA